MPSYYERDEGVPPVKIPHYPSKSPQPRIGIRPELPAESTSAAADVSYADLMVASTLEAETSRSAAS